MRKTKLTAKPAHNGFNHHHGEVTSPSQNPTTPRPPWVSVKWPAEGGVIAVSEYTLQIDAGPGTDDVDVSINMGEWRPCREALGLWWYDWKGFSKGEYELVARCHTIEGNCTVSTLRRITVS